MAMRFTFSRPSAMKVLPAIPGVPRIISIAPPISTPGSIITITGDSLSTGPQIYIGGIPAAVVETPSATRIVARVPPDLSINGSSINTPVFVVDGFGRASNNLPVGIDLVEPYILTDSDGGPSIVDAVTRQTIRQGTPLKAGNSIEIRCTGLTANDADHTRISPLLGVSVKLDGVTLTSLATVVADPMDSGYWKVTVQVPATTAPGRHSMQLVGTVTLSNNGVVRPYVFPSTAVDLWTTP